MDSSKPFEGVVLLFEFSSLERNRSTCREMTRAICSSLVKSLRSPAISLLEKINSGSGRVSTAIKTNSLFQ